jgi:hypothetical protein
MSYTRHQPNISSHQGYYIISKVVTTAFCYNPRIIWRKIRTQRKKKIHCFFSETLLLIWLKDDLLPRLTNDQYNDALIANNNRVSLNTQWAFVPKQEINILQRNQDVNDSRGTLLERVLMRELWVPVNSTR